MRSFSIQHSDLSRFLSGSHSVQYIFFLFVVNLPTIKKKSFHTFGRTRRMPTSQDMKRTEKITRVSCILICLSVFFVFMFGLWKTQKKIFFLFWWSKLWSVTDISSKCVFVNIFFLLWFEEKRANLVECGLFAETKEERISTIRRIDNENIIIFIISVHQNPMQFHGMKNLTVYMSWMKCHIFSWFFKHSPRSNDYFILFLQKKRETIDKVAIRMSSSIEDYRWKRKNQLKFLLHSDEAFRFKK